MVRIVTRMAIFFLLLNLASGVVMATGVGQTIGIETSLSGDSAVQTAENQADNIQPGSESKDTLFGMYVRMTNTVASALGPLFEGPDMLRQLGVPEEITSAITTVVSVVYAFGIASFLRGFDII